MPVLPPADGVARVVISGQWDTKAWANIFHVRCAPGPIPQGQLDEIVTIFHNWWSTSIAPHVSNAVSVDQVQAVDIGSSTGAVSTNSVVIVGGVAGNAYPPNTSFLINWKINRRYRGGHPRTYLPGPTQNDSNTAGVVLPGSITAMNTAANALINNLLLGTTLPGGYALSTVHYHLGHVLLTVPIVDAIQAGTCNGKLATQRRRLR